MKRVVILDGQTIQTLPIAKSLKNQGYCVILFCDNKKSYGYRTKYADEVILVPSIKDELEEFKRFFISYLGINSVDIIIPMNDYSAEFLSFNKYSLLKYCHFIMPDYDVFMRGYDKNLLMKVCVDNHFPHPKTADLSKMSIEESVRYVRFPSLIKPNKATGARGFTIVQSIHDIYENLPKVKEVYGDCHLQEYLPEGGRQYKVQVFIYKNELINATVMNKIRFYPKKGGSSCFSKTIECNHLVGLCFQVLKTIGWSGFADFDLIEDTRDNVVKIIEINPRVPACIKAAFYSGIDFAENITQCSMGLSPRKDVYQPGVYLRYLGLDLLWLLNSDKTFKTFQQWVKYLFSPKQFLQDGSIDDPKPFIYGTLGGFLKQLNPRFRAAKKGMN